MVIKVLYCIFLGVLLVLFVAWAMAALYPAPDWESEYAGVPRYESPPDKPTALDLEGLSAAQKRAKLQDYETSLKRYEAEQEKREELHEALSDKTERRARNVSLLSLLISVLVMAVGVGFASSLPVIAEGLLLGGLFTLIFSIGLGFAHSPKTAVIPVGVGLIVTIALGYKRFVRTGGS